MAKKDPTSSPMNLDIERTVKKSNLLNEVRNANAKPVEYRLFCVYLAHMKLNSDDNVVKFRLADYAKICGLDRPRRTDLEAQANNIVGVTAQVNRPDGGFSVYNLFSEFRLFKEDEEWMVSLECNSKIAPMIREQRGKFLRYKLYNTIFLKSYNHQRIYELLKQYQTIGVRLFNLQDLREYLSIGKNEYPVWGDFSQKVIKTAQKALKENTDICFDYEPIKKGRKVVQVRFTIYENPNFIDQLNIDDFLPATVDAAELSNETGLIVRAEDPADAPLFGEDPETPESLCAAVLPDSFTPEQVQAIYLAALPVAPYDPESELSQEEQVAMFLKQKVAVMQAAKKPIAHPYNYLLKVLSNTPAPKQTPAGTPGFEPGEEEIAAMQRMMAGYPKTVGSDPELAAKAEELRKSLQK